MGEISRVPFRRALITGGSGFVGSHLARKLRAGGCSIVATSRDTRHVSEDGFSWVNADLAEHDVARKVIAEARPDVIFHLAGQVSASPEVGLVVPAFRSLLSSTVNVLSVAAELNHVPVVLLGSITEPPADGMLACPKSPYAAAKWAASGYGRMFHQLYGTPVVIVRLFMAYGPRQAPEKLIPSVILSLKRSVPPRLSSGAFRGDWVFIDDAIDGIVRAAASPACYGRTVDIGTGKLSSIRDVVSLVQHEIAGGVDPVWGAVPDRPGENEMIADTRRTERLLGWKAETSLGSGLKKTVHWYLNEFRA